MKSLIKFIIALMLLLQSAVSTAEIIIATYDMTFRGILFKDNEWAGFISDPIKDTITLTFNLNGANGFEQRDWYSSYIVQDFNNPSVLFQSNVMEDILSSHASEQLSLVGSSTLQPSSPFSYFTAIKQMVPEWGNQYVTRFDAYSSTDQTVDLNTDYQIDGMNASTRLNTRVWLTSDTRTSSGNGDPFTPQDIPTLMKYINSNVGESGFWYDQFTRDSAMIRIDYESRLDVWYSSPDYSSFEQRMIFDVDFQGMGKMTNLTVDGVDILASVPEPSTILIVLIGLGSLFLTVRGKQITRNLRS